MNDKIIRDISDSGYIPVIAPLAAGVDGKTYNVNADTAAGSIAKALGAEKLILLTDVPGVLDAESQAHLVVKSRRGEKTGEERDGEGRHDPEDHVLSRCARGGVKKTHIIDGRVPHALLLEVFTDSGIGTQIAGE